MQDSIFYCLDDSLSEENPGHRCIKLFGDKVTKKLLSWLGIPGNFNKVRSCSYVYSESLEIFGE